MRIFKHNLLVTGTILALGAMLSSPALATGGKGMTWRVKDIGSSTNAAQVAAWNALPRNVVVVGCHEGGQSCDAYKGDTVITETRRIMCFVPGRSAEPAGYAAVFNGINLSGSASQDWHFYYGWSGGQVGLSKPYTGSALTSRAVGDKFCQADLRDPAARMIEHHDNKVGGWFLGGTIHPNSQAKGHLQNSDCADPRSRNYWAAIDGQPANPWNP